MSNRFNGYMTTHFRGLPIVLQFEDPHRHRQVQVFDVGDDKVLGVTNGVESWMIPKAGAIHGVPCSTLHPIEGVRKRVPTYKKQEAPRQADAGGPGVHLIAASGARPRVRVLIHD